MSYPARAEGFGKYDKSTITNILENIDIINEYLIEEDNVDRYLDFSKIFHMLSHYRLLVKMRSFGVSKKILTIERYFSKIELCENFVRIILKHRIYHPVFLRDRY